MVIAQASTLARAAPWMPMGAIGPAPKISSGSSSRFNPEETTMMAPDRRVSPAARKMLLQTMFSTRNTEPENQRVM